jgi:CheY-like chemotaxis protein
MTWGTSEHELLDRALEIPNRDTDTVSPRQPGVLIAIEDLWERADLASTLTRRGFAVWTAACGVEAITTYLEHTGSVDVLLLDAELPDLPGLAFLRRFKTHFPGVPCVFRAGTSDTVSRQLRAAGAIVMPPSIALAELAERLWEVVACEGWVGG